MLLLYWMLFFLIGFALFLLMPSLIGLTIYQRYRGPRAITCPEEHRAASVTIDARYAAFTGMAATEQLRLADCSLWPEHGGCAQRCIDQAKSVPAIPESTQPARVLWFPVHFPAWLTASAVFWVLGMFWYSDRYLFRDRWVSLAGYDPQTIHHLVRTWAPHLITWVVAMTCTLGIAWALEIFGHHNLKSGIQVGLGFWLVISVAIAAAVLRSSSPYELIWIHAGYALLACTAAGAIMGAWQPGSIVRWLDREG